MRGIVNYVRGTVRVEISGLFPERVINLCAQNRVEFWAVDWVDEHCVCLTLCSAGLARLHRFAEKVDCQVRERWRRGFPEFAGAFRRRYGFLIGLCLALCMVGIMSRFVLTIQITGNETVSDAVILQQLQRYGVQPGAYGPGLDRRQIEQEILLDLEELAWMTINLNGTRVEVQVKERQKAPERVDESGFYHVVARADGIVTHVEAELGDALIAEGDTVGKGEVLISGTVTMEPPVYSDLPERYYYVHARGRVWARTWRSVTAVVEETAVIKRYTGKEHLVLAVNFFGNRVEFFGNSSISDGFYDKITSVRQGELPDGEKLPLWLTREVYREYETDRVNIQRDAACDLLEQELRRRLETLVGEDGQVLNVTFETRISDGLIRVTATGECLEEIGQEVPAQREM